MNTHVQEAERPAYLARVLSVAFHDGVIGALELRALRGVMLRIGASVADLQRGLELRLEDRSLPPLRSPIARMQCVQDMVMVALADGTLADAEAAPIEQLAGVLRYSQADMDIIVKRAEAELRRVMQSIQDGGGLEGLFRTLSKPGSSAHQPAAEPSGTSGTPATPSPPALPPKPPPLKTMPAGPRPVPVPGTPEPPSAVEKPAPSTARPADPQTSSLQEADEGMQVAAQVPEAAQSGGARTQVEACAECRRAAEQGDSYCFGAGSDEVNIWGCRLLGMPWLPGAVWLESGSFGADGGFVFDRGALAEMLVEASRDVAACEFFDVDFLDAALEALPRRADTYGRWTLRVAEPGQRGQRLEVTEYLHGCAVKRDVDVVGVDPVGTVQARKVARRAASRAGRELPEL